MAKIKKIIAREILDSRASPTIEAIIQLADGSVGIFSSPSGISIGKSEAHELRDHDLKRYRGLGVLVALEKIARDIAPHLIGIEASDQRQIDQKEVAHRRLRKGVDRGDHPAPGEEGAEDNQTEGQDQEDEVPGLEHPPAFLNHD